MILFASLKYFPCSGYPYQWQWQDLKDHPEERSWRWDYHFVWVWRHTASCSCHRHGGQCDDLYLRHGWPPYRGEPSCKRHYKFHLWCSRQCADQADCQPCEGRQVHHLRLRLSASDGYQLPRSSGEQREVLLRWPQRLSEPYRSLDAPWGRNGCHWILLWQDGRSHQDPPHNDCA